MGSLLAGFTCREETMRRNSLLELASGALIGAMLIVAPAAHGQTSSTPTGAQMPQSSTAQQSPATPPTFPQDQASPASPDKSATQDQQASPSTQLPQDQNRRDDTRPVEQPPSTQLPQDQSKSPQGDQASPATPSSQDPMAVKPRSDSDEDNMNVQPRRSDDNMAVRPHDQTASPSGTKSSTCVDPDNDGDCHAVAGSSTQGDLDQGTNAHKRKHKKHHKKTSGDTQPDTTQSPR